jgi:glutamate carboxypeptidase
MKKSGNESESSQAPILREQVQRVRDVLLELHRALLAWESENYARDRGPLARQELLRLLLESNEFAWLRPMSTLIADMDVLIDADHVPSAWAYRDLLHQTVEMFRLADEAAEFTKKYRAALQQSLDSAGRHGELRALLRDVGSGAARRTAEPAREPGQFMPTPQFAALGNFVESQMPATLELLRQMVAINSFTGNREGVNQLGKLTADCFAPLGFVAETVPSVNPHYGDHLVLTRPGRSSRCIAMVSHLDTVFPPEEEIRNNFRWQPEGDRIYGPGTHDIKGGTAMMWLVLKTLQSQAPAVFEEITWKLFWNSSEETLSQDFGEVCRTRFNPGTLGALVFESEGRLGQERLMVVARKGRGTWRVTVTGRGAHAGAKHQHGANAIVQLTHTLQRIAALTDHSRDLTFNVGTVSGGTVLNRVPHEAFAEGEFRAFTPEVYASAKAALLALAGPGEVRSLADRYPCDVQVEILSESRPWPRNAQTDRLAAIWCQAGTELGLPVNVEQRGGLSDGNLIWDAVPTLDGLGPWGDNDHCSERSADGSKVPEYVDVPSFAPKAVLNTIAILKLAGEAG